MPDVSLSRAMEEIFAAIAPELVSLARAELDTALAEYAVEIDAAISHLIPALPEAERSALAQEVVQALDAGTTVLQHAYLEHAPPEGTA